MKSSNMRIKKIAVLGSGIMGSGIACHMANIGFEVLLLDLPSSDNNKGRNSVADEALQIAIKSKPAALYDKSFASRIKTGNFEDHFKEIKHSDWIIEAVVERLDIKIQIFEKVEQFRSPGSFVSSNTSGIPIAMMEKGRSDEFKKHFLGTHFFNPPRYLRLLEIIPGRKTDQSVIDFFMEFGSTFLGKQTVLCKDTPAFIANRIGVFAMGNIFNLSYELGLDIATVDKLTGPAISRPNTGTFRLADLVGLDTAVKVIEGIKANCPKDEMAQKMGMPKFLNYLVEHNYLGNKSGQGFYRKTDEKDAKGRTIIEALNLKTLTYENTDSEKLASIELSKQIDDPAKRFKAIFNHEDLGGQLIRKSFAALFSYASQRIPEIADSIYAVDHALKAGFAWDYGPFEYWDIIGVEEGIQVAEKEGYHIADWVKSMLAAGGNTFYKFKNGQKKYFDLDKLSYQPIPGSENQIILDALREQQPVFKNSEVTLHDIGDGVLCLEFTSKMNAIGEGILRGLYECIDIAETQNWKGLVIANESKNFTVGANLMMIAMLAYQQEFDELNMAVNLFQRATMRCRYSKIPVVAATQGYVFGGGCELIMHCDSNIIAAESYIGLVEVGVGLLPGGAGTKEFAVRLSDSFSEGDVKIPSLIERFKTIATASVATSAHEAFGMGYLQTDKDQVTVNSEHRISKAKKEVLRLANNYIMPTERDDVYVLGRQGLGALYTAAHSLYLGGYATEHDIKIAKKIAFVLCGGDLTGPQKVSEQYLLDIEREAFLSLCGEPKTLERIQHMLEKGKPLRN
jgi:3-hydroxyacyl-CoA dehydrogenase